MKSFVSEHGLSVGNAHIDHQHDGIIRTFEQLKRYQPTDSDSEQRLHILISNLIITMSLHFSDEEDLMMRNGCPRYAIHAEQHVFFIEQLSQALQMSEEEILRNGIPLLADIMMEHLTTEDMACRAYLTPASDSED